MILVVLNTFGNLLIASNKHIPLQGVCQKADTSITLNLEQIKQINTKLIEREYYKDLNILKDSLIIQKISILESKILLLESVEKKLLMQQFLTKNFLKI